MLADPLSSAPADVIILGGGVAALEAMMGLRELAGDRVRISLVSAAEDFVERPMSVTEPFGLGTARRYPLREIATDFGVRFVHAAAIGVDAREPRLVFADGATLAGSTLILAPGARTLAPFPQAITFAWGTPARPFASSWATSSAARSGAWPSSRRAWPAGRCRCTSWRS
jgi:sulfide:quinone oxidoreductase